MIIGFYLRNRKIVTLNYYILFEVCIFAFYMCSETENIRGFPKNWKRSVALVSLKLLTRLIVGGEEANKIFSSTRAPPDTFYSLNLDIILKETKIFASYKSSFLTLNLFDYINSP